jgi:hypothetical protein
MVRFGYGMKRHVVVDRILFIVHNFPLRRDF